jgi:hypothetical protein
MCSIGKPETYLKRFLDGENVRRFFRDCSIGDAPNGSRRYGW